MLKPSSCDSCVICNLSNGFSNSEGLGTNGVAIIGEANGYNEFLDGLPFRPHAQAGSLLEQVFKLVSKDLAQPITRSQFTISNVLRCNPFNDKFAGMPWEQEAVEHCRPNVDEVMRRSGARVVLALGNVALKAMTGVSGIAEEKQSISHLRGFVMEGRYGPTISSLHPSFVRRGNGHLTPLLIEDMKKALGVAKGLYTNYPSHKGYVAPVYQTSPSLDEAWSFYYKVRDSSKLVLSYDIETNETGSIDEDERDELESAEIILVQFSVSKGTGIALSWNAEFMPIIMALFALPNAKANHNTWNFDNPRLRAKGVAINGKVHDTMWMWKHWTPKLPRSLQSVASMLGFPFPWKHLYQSQLEYYGCADVDAVQWIVHSLPKLMKARGVWEGYVNHVYNIHPILDRASVVGIPVNEERRIALEADFKVRREGIHKELQKAIPDECRNIKPKRKLENGLYDYGYIREPKTIGIEFERYNRLSKELTQSGCRVKSFEDYLYLKHQLTSAEFEDLDETTRESTRVNRWCVIEPFRASSVQMIRYLKWKQNKILEEVEKLEDERKVIWNGKNPELTTRINELKELAEEYAVPVSLKTKRPTTDKKELEEIYFNTGDEVLEKVVRIRSLDTNINNYLPNWEPRKDGRVHTTFGFTSPSGQFDSRRPNVLNCSKHTEYGQEFRKIIQAPNGYTFVEFDFKSYHVCTMGYCANDRDYLRFATLDPHSIFGSYISPTIIGQSISMKWTDEEIIKAAKEFKKRSKEIKEKDPLHGVDVRQDLAKASVLGNQLGLGPKKLQRQNRRFIKTVAEAEKYQKMLADLFPKVEAYKTNIKERAHLEKFLINPFGYIQYFYEVFTFSMSKHSRQWIRREGEGAREPISFMVQGSAFGKLHLDMLECERLGYNEKYNLVVSIHDSLMFMPKINDIDECIAVVHPILSKPCSILTNAATGPNGLSVGVETFVGNTWATMEERKL